jgi:hypothetical protein
MTKENYIKGKLEGLRTVYPSGKIAEEQFSIKYKKMVPIKNR